MRSATAWVCPNPNCHRSFSTSELPGSEDGRRCSCGTVLKKPYASPVFQYLDFLRADDGPFTKPPYPEKGSRK